MTPALRLTLALHALGVLVLVAEPALWPWIAGTLIANHLVLCAGVFFVRGRLLGPNLSRLPASAAAHGQVCLTFDDGPDPDVTPRVLDLLEGHHAKASFFCVGEKARSYPELVKEIARRGHSVENHSYRHSAAFAFYGAGLLESEIRATQSIVTDLTGRPPQFFRAPIGFRSPLLAPVLERLGLRYVSWTRRGLETIANDSPRVLSRLTSGLAAGDVLLLHDNAPGALDVLPALLEQLSARGLRSVSLPIACSRS